MAAVVGAVRRGRDEEEGVYLRTGCYIMARAARRAVAGARPRGRGAQYEMRGRPSTWWLDVVEAGRKFGPHHKIGPKSGRAALARPDKRAAGGEPVGKRDVERDQEQA